jgi:hypothetical protein
LIHHPDGRVKDDPHLGMNRQRTGRRPRAMGEMSTEPITARRGDVACSYRNEPEITISAEN